MSGISLLFEGWMVKKYTSDLLYIFRYDLFSNKNHFVIKNNEFIYFALKFDKVYLKTELNIVGK